MYIQEKSKKKTFIENCIDKLFDLCRVQFWMKGVDND